MEEISTRTIPYGINRGTRPNEKHTIENVIKGDVYTCPQCGNRLDPRIGYIRRYFAHWWGTSHVKGSCIYGSAEEQQESIRLCEHAIDSNRFRIRLFITKRPHSSELVLYGSIPTLNLEDLKLVKQDSQPIRIESVGTCSQVSKNDLLPCSEGAMIELDPSAQSYTINISPPISIAGRWWADGLKSNDFFIGDELRGEFFKDPHYLTSDESVYIISPTFITDLPNEADKLRLGSFEVVRLDVNRDVLQVLKLSGHELFLDDNPIRVDVIRPFTANPRTQMFGYVHGPPGSEALVAITPPPNLDPEFKLIPLPSFKGEDVTLPPAGVGTPRFFRISLDKMQSKRLLIYLPGKKHRNTLLDFSLIPPPEARRPSRLAGVAESETEPLAPTTEAEPEPFSSFEFGVEARVGGTIQKALAMFSQRLELHPITADSKETVLPKLRLLCRRRYKVKLEAEHPGPDCRPVWVNEGETDANGFPRLASSTIQSGAKTLRVHFASLGTVEICCNYFYQQVLDEQVMKASKDYLDRLDQLPRSVYRSFVKKCIKSSGMIDCSESEIDKWKPIIRKKVKRLRKQRRRQRKLRNKSSGDNKLTGGPSDE